MSDWNHISLWMQQVGDITPRPQLNADIEADVVIIGAGFTGLWTAYYLKQHKPELNVVILESEVAGFGASGRNGGWLMGQIVGQDDLLKSESHEKQIQARSILASIPDEVASVISKEGIACDFKKAGVYYIAARYKEQQSRLKAYFELLKEKGYSEADFKWIAQDQLKKSIAVNNAYGAIYSPHCATIQPAKLARGLASCIEGKGVSLYEKSRVIKWQPGKVITERGSVSAQWVVPALEAYGAELQNSPVKLSRYHLPVQSLIIATEPLSDSHWEKIGLSNGEAFADHSRQVTYGIRSADNRLVFGARGTYQFGSKLRQNFSLTDAEIQERRKVMVELFPSLRDVKVSHAWGGNLAVARKFRPHVVRNYEKKFVLSGGYGGEGVGATNLFGRTLADLVLGRLSDLVAMPWVKTSTDMKHIQKWESEPFPWLGYKSVIQAFDFEDRVLNSEQSPKWKRKLAMNVADIFEKIVQ